MDNLMEYIESIDPFEASINALKSKHAAGSFLNGLQVHYTQL